MEATTSSSSKTNGPCISPLMILVKTVAIALSIPASSQLCRRGVAAYLGTLNNVTDLGSPRTAELAACPTRSYVLDIVIPVYNEERDLPGSVRRLHAYLAA